MDNNVCVSVLPDFTFWLRDTCEICKVNKSTVFTCDTQHPSRFQDIYLCRKCCDEWRATDEVPVVFTVSQLLLIEQALNELPRYDYKYPIYQRIKEAIDVCKKDGK